MRLQWMAPILALAATLTLATTAFAGDDATASLDSHPRPSAGEPVEIGFVLRQHGETPVSWPDAYITATNPETGESLRADARPRGAVGHYVATLTLPSAGTWTWAIATAELEVTTALQPLTVSPSASTSTETTPPSILLAVAAIAVLTTLVAAVGVRRMRSARQRRVPVSV